MKSQGHPHIFLWLAEDGWEGGHEIQAERHDAQTIAVTMKPWENLVLVTPGILNPN